MNPQFQGAWLNGNNSNSTCHAMKLEASRRFSSGYNKLTTGDASTVNCNTACDPYITSKVIKNDPSGRLYALTAAERALFTQPAAGSAGQTAQSYFRGPSNWVADASVFKMFKLRLLGDQGLPQSRFEFINAFNHPRFGTPTSTLTSATFGQVSAPTSNYRIIRVAMKILF